MAKWSGLATQNRCGKTSSKCQWQMCT